MGKVGASGGGEGLGVCWWTGGGRLGPGGVVVGV